MRIMVLGRMGVERSTLEGLLSDAGHVVAPCHDRSWGCVGMDGPCPMDAGAVDVAVAVAEASGRFEPQGVACAYRARIPIIAVGATPGDPVLDFVATTVDHGDHAVLEALEAVHRSERTTGD